MDDEPISFTVHERECGNHSLIYCPIDNNCYESITECAELSGGYCKDSTQYRCWDNSCVNYPTLCHCPENYKRCNNRCVPANEKCNFEICSADQVLCLDNKCANSYKECNPFPYAPIYYRLCPSSFIYVLNLSECDLFVEAKCSKEVPFLCSDQSTCVHHYTLCPQYPRCPPGYYYCITGHCVEDPVLCPLLPECPKGILCNDGSCSVNHNSCPQHSYCPKNQITGPNNLCYDKIEDIPISTCPDRMRLCPQGTCAPYESLCPNTIYCPLNMYKCWDGNCVSDIKECNPSIVCGFNKTVCPSGGGCAIDRAHCPSLLQCPPDSILCSNGLCVDNLSKCEEEGIPRCPLSRPYRCPNGDCVQSGLQCNSNIVCPFDFPVLCNGECVPSPDFCKILEKCENGLKLCPTGDCVAFSELCPRESQCKDGYIKCWDRTCAYYNTSYDLTFENCVEDLLYNNYLLNCECDNGLVYCNGKCVEMFLCPNYNEELLNCYESAINRATGNCNNLVYNYPCHQLRSDTVCSLNGLIKCGDGSCKTSRELCPTVVSCPLDLHIFFIFLYLLYYL